jgi:hypothetical protein
MQSFEQLNVSKKSFYYLNKYPLRSIDNTFIRITSSFKNVVTLKKAGLKMRKNIIFTGMNARNEQNKNIKKIY